MLVSGRVLEDVPALVFGPVRSGFGAAPAAAAVPAARKARPKAHRAAVRRALAERAERVAAAPASRSATRRAATPAARRAVVARARVVAFARSKIGARYGTSRGRYDCSKLVQLAYRSAGVSLPRQSGAIARRARAVSWRNARAGDIIVGRGHVGIYMGKRGGRPMMIDSGNSRTGVVYRAVYFNSQGLHPETVF